MLPLDLHVLSLSLAFILSQDQTLRCVYLSCSFLCVKGHPNGERPAPLIQTPHWLRPDAERAARDLFTCHFGILTGDPRNPFLVSHLLVRFPHRKHVNDLRLPARAHPFGRASKKPLNSERVLVSRKALQNYNRFTTRQNIFTFFFKKNALLLKIAWFGTQEWTFRDTRGCDRRDSSAPFPWRRHHCQGPCILYIIRCRLLKAKAATADMRRNVEKNTKHIL